MSVEAEWPGECPTCGHRFPAGAPIRMVEVGWAHNVCPEDKPVPPPCPHCFQVPAANGACGCDD